MYHVHQRGIALVSGLFVMVAVVLLGVGAVFLSTSSLRVAENVRGQATARSAAESGVDVAYLVLADAYDSNGAFPASLALPTDATHSLLGYRRDGPGQAFVQVLGVANGGAEYVAEALLSVVAQPPTTNPVYDLGLASEGTVTVNGGASVYLDAGVHGNAGFSLMGGFESCTDRDEFGVCITREPLLGTPPVSLSDPTGPCSFPGGTCTNVADFLAPEIAVSPDYIGRRNRAADLDGDGSFDAGDCAGKPSTATNVMSNTEICATGGVSLNNPVLNNVVIVAQGNITLSGTAQLTNTTLISLNGTVSIAKGTMEGTSIYSQNSVTFSGNGGNYVWNGSNTIATGGAITFNGANKNTNTVNPVVQDDGTKAIGLVLVADGDVTFNGRNDGSDKYYAVWITGGSFTQNGRSEVYGSVAAVGDIRFNGNFFIDSGLGIVNDEVNIVNPPLVAVVSRR
jgi:hypothetical protein